MHDPNAEATPDVTVVLRVRDDEDRVGHAIVSVARHLRTLAHPFELLVADESSGDNSVAIATLLRREFPEVAVVHTAIGRGFYRGSQQARGRALVLLDARTELVPDNLTAALLQLRAGRDLVVDNDRFVALRRARAWRTFTALVTSRRRPRAIERRLTRRARGLSLRWLNGTAKRSLLQRCLGAVPTAAASARPTAAARSVVRAPAA